MNILRLCLDELEAIREATSTLKLNEFKSMHRAKIPPSEEAVTRHIKKTSGEREALNKIITQPDMRVVLRRLRETFGARADQAWNLVKHGKVRRYVFKPSGKVVWTVTGETDEHLIYEAVGYCHCKDFNFKFDTGYICQHIIAQKLAERKGRFERVEMKDGDYGKFMCALRNGKVSSANLGNLKFSLAKHLNDETKTNRHGNGRPTE